MNIDFADRLIPLIISVVIAIHRYLDNSCENSRLRIIPNISTWFLTKLFLLCHMKLLSLSLGVGREHTRSAMKSLFTNVILTR